jgi:hypothetical protein
VGIRDKRFYRAINRILREELQRGNLPSSKEFSWRLNNYLREHSLSRPEYNFKPVREGSTASSYEYNKAMDSVHGDLSTLYESTIDLHNMLAKNFSKFEVDKSKLEYEVNILESKLKELILLYSKNGFLSTVYDVFDDMAKIDVAQSTAHVDIKKHELSIPEIKNTSRKIIPNASVAFSILPEIEKNVEVIPVSGKPSAALNDNINETWQELILTEMKQNVAGYYYIDFEEKQMMNRINISLHGAKPTLVRVEFTPDNLNWFTLPYHEEGRVVAAEYSFDFPSLEVEQLRILLSKSEPDGESNIQSFSQDMTADKYKYIMGIKHIGMYELSYPPKADLVSVPLQVSVPAGQNFSVNKVSLSVEEEVPPATDIRYWIAIPPTGDRAIEWKPISPVERENPRYEQIVDFRNITRAPAMKMGIDDSKSLAEYEMENYYANGIKFYKIGEVDNKQIINSTERLFVGKDTWGMKRFHHKWADHENHIPSIKDWEKPQDYEYDYVTIEDGKPGLLLSGLTEDGSKEYNYMFTVGVLSEKAQEVESAIPAGNQPIAIYVNGELIFQGIPSASNRVPYKFNFGWNEITVLVYVSDVGTGPIVDIGLDVRKHGANIYSKAQPMEQVKLDDLRYNVKSNDRNKYAIEVVNEKSYVILNHAVPGLTYDFFFNYVEGEAKDTILFKAELSKNEQHSTISPKLKSYRIRFS